MFKICSQSLLLKIFKKAFLLGLLEPSDVVGFEWLQPCLQPHQVSFFIYFNNIMILKNKKNNRFVMLV